MSDRSLHTEKGFRKFLVASIFLATALTSTPGLALTCDSGARSTTCVIGTNQTATAGTTETISGNLVLNGTGIIYDNTKIQSFDLEIGGDLIMRTGSKIKGNPNISAQNVNVEQGALINATALGYPGGPNAGSNGSGPGGGEGDSAIAGGGAGYGGEGSAGASTSSQGGEGGTGYGNTVTPLEFGSGGGAGDFKTASGDNNGGEGGGRILLNASKNVTINGTLLANGENGHSGNPDSNPGGAGSGGTIRIISNYSKGFGTVNATGGDGGEFDTQTGGGGSGGRIAFNSDNFQFNGDLSVIGGSGKTGASTGTLYPFTILCDKGTVDTECVVQDRANVGEVSGTGKLKITTGTIESGKNLRLNFSAIDLQENGSVTAGNNINLTGTDSLNLSGNISSQGPLILPNSSINITNVKTNTSDIIGGPVNLTGTNYSIGIKDVSGLQEFNITDFLDNYSLENTQDWIRRGEIYTSEILTLEASNLSFGKHFNLTLGHNSRIKSLNDIILENSVKTGTRKVAKINANSKIDLKPSSNLKGNFNISGSSITIRNGSRINATGEGYGGGESGTRQSGNGPGKSYPGADTFSAPFEGAGGAGYGGQGGDGNGNNNLQGVAYGSFLDPYNFGSGGATSGGGGVSGEDGGGAVVLKAKNRVTINGSVLANGIDVTPFSLSDQGPGSGGSIRIKGSELKGSGKVSAEGGNGTDEAGVAAGGRIFISAPVDSTNVSFSVKQGEGLLNGQDGTIVSCQGTSKISCPYGPKQPRLHSNFSKNTAGMYLNRKLKHTDSKTGNWSGIYVEWKDNETDRFTISPEESSIQATYNVTGLVENLPMKIYKNGGIIQQKQTSSSGSISFTETLDGGESFTIRENVKPTFQNMSPVNSNPLEGPNELIRGGENIQLSSWIQDNHSGITRVELQTDLSGSLQTQPYYTKTYNSRTDPLKRSVTWVNSSEVSDESVINWRLRIKDRAGNWRSTDLQKFEVDTRNPLLANATSSQGSILDPDNTFETKIHVDSFDENGKNLRYNNQFKSIEQIQITEDSTGVGQTYSMFQDDSAATDPCNTYEPPHPFYPNVSAPQCAQNIHQWYRFVNSSTVQDIDYTISATDLAGNSDSYTDSIEFRNITLSFNMDDRNVYSQEPINITGDSLLRDEDFTDAPEDVASSTVYYKTKTDGTFQTVDSHSLSNFGGSGEFQNLISTEVAGTHILKVQITNNRGVSGEETRRYNVSLDVRNPESKFLSSNTSYLDIDNTNENINISTFITRSTDSEIKNATLKIQHPNSTTFNYFMENTVPLNNAGIWKKVLNTTEEFEDRLGAYRASINASTVRGIGSNVASTSFFKQNLTVNSSVNTTLLPPGRQLEIEGDVKLQPNNTLLDGTEGGKVMIYVDNASKGPVAETNISGAGHYLQNFTAPFTGGAHTVIARPVDKNNISGKTVSEFFTAIELNENASSVKTGLSYVNANEKVNTSVYISPTNLDYPDVNISTVRANITLPDGSTEIYNLQGNESGGTWSGEFNSTSQLGNYTVNYLANLTNGFSEQFRSNTSFKVQNLSVSQFYSNKTVGSNESTVISGFANVTPDGNRAQGAYTIYRDKGYGYTLLKSGSLNSSGGYKNSFRTPVAGTHYLKTTVNDTRGITGIETSSFNVSLKVSEPDATFPASGTDHLDIDENSHQVNLSTYLSNSTDSLTNASVKVQKPFRDSYTRFYLENTTYRNRSQTWYRVLNTNSDFGDALGKYDTVFNASTERGIGSNTRETSFFLQNITLTLNIRESTLDWDSQTQINGTGTLEPNNTGIRSSADIYIDGNSIGSTSTDNSGFFSTTLLASEIPDTAGRHMLKVNSTNTEGISGEEKLEFRTKIALQNETANGLRTSKNYVNPREDVNLSVDIPEFSIAEDKELSAVQAVIKNSSGNNIKTISLNGNRRGGTWSKVYTDTPGLGNYTVSFNAVLNNTYGTQQISETVFRVRNGSITQSLDQSLNSSEKTTVTGTATILPTGEAVTTKAIFYRNTTGSWDNIQNTSLNGFGDYSQDISTYIAGTHQLMVNTTSSNSITGTVTKNFNVSLNISEEKSVFRQTGVSALDVDSSDHIVNITSNISRSIDSAVKRADVTIEDPENNRQTYSLNNARPRNEAGKWYREFNTSQAFNDRLGYYTARLNASTERGIESNYPETVFKIENITLNQRVDDKKLDASSESLVFNGTATYSSNNSAVSGETVKANIDGSYSGNSQTLDSNGFYSFSFTPPSDAGTHELSVSVNDSRGIYGLNSTEFDVLINLNSETATSQSTGNTHANIGDTIDLSVDVPSYTVPFDQNIQYVKAEIDSPGTGPENISLSGPSDGGTFTGTYSSTGDLGEYNVSFYTALDSGFSQQVDSKTSFTVENISLTRDLDSKVVNSGETLTINGYAGLEPGGQAADGTLRVYRDTGSGYEQLNSFSVTGSYSTGIETYVAGTHRLMVNFTDSNGIKGYNETSFNTTLDVSKTNLTFQGTGTSTLDVKNENSLLNISAFVSNSSDSSIQQVRADVNLPNGTVDSLLMQNIQPTTQSGTWYRQINVSKRYSKQSGAYDVEFKANTTRGIGSNIPVDTFFIQSIKITADMSKRLLNPGESVQVSGTAELVSDNTAVSNEDVSVLIDQQPLPSDPVTLTDSSGYYQHTFTGPETAGEHEIQTNITNQENVSGFNRSTFETRINVTSGASRGVKTGTSKLNYGENTSLSVNIPSSNIDSSRQLDTVKATITGPSNEKKEVILSGSSSGGVFTGETNFSSRTGTYEVNYTANLTTGFSKQIAETTTYDVQNLTVRQNLSDRNVNLSEQITVNGNTTLIPDGTGTQGTVKITKYVQGLPAETVTVKTLNTTGGFNQVLQTEHPGTHVLETNVTDVNGVNGSTRKTFNVSLELRNPESIFQKTESPVNDVDSPDSDLNLSVFVTNSSTGLVDKTEAEITAPNGTVKTVQLQPETGKDVSNTWKKVSNTENLFGDLLGQYNISYTAQTERGIGSNNVKTQFNVRNISITSSLNDTGVNPGEISEISGKAIREPENTNVSGRTVKVIFNGTKIAEAITQTQGTFSTAFNAPETPGTYSIKVEVNNSNGIDGENSSQIKVLKTDLNFSSTSENIFRDDSNDGDVSFTDQLGASNQNPGQLTGVTLEYNTPAELNEVSSNTPQSILDPGEKTSRNPVYDIENTTSPGPLTVQVNSGTDRGITSSLEENITVWTRSEPGFLKTPDVVSRKSDNYLVNISVTDSVTGENLSDIPVTVFVDSNQTAVVNTSQDGQATFNWTVSDYSPGEHNISAEPQDQPARYINSSGKTSFTTEISGKIQIDEYNSVNNPVYRKDGITPESTFLSARLVDSQNQAIEGANLTFRIGDRNRTSQTDQDGYASFSYNPEDRKKPGNYTVEIIANKQNFREVTRNESLTVKGVLKTTQENTYGIYRRGINYRKNLSVRNEFGENISAGITWKLDDTELSLEGREITYSPSIVSSLGQHNFSATVTKPFYRSDTDLKEIQIYGNADIDSLRPESSNLLPNNSYNISSHLVDANLTNDITDLPVKLEINNTGTLNNTATNQTEGFTVIENLTDNSGYLNYSWRPERGNYTIKAFAKDNSSLKYNITNSPVTSKVEIAKNIVVDQLNLSNEELYRDDARDPHTTNFTAKILETAKSPGMKPANNTVVRFRIGSADTVYCTTNADGVCTTLYNASENVSSGDVELSVSTDREGWNNPIYKDSVFIRDSLDITIVSPEREILNRGERILLNASAISNGQSVNISSDWRFRGQDIAKDKEYTEWKIPEDEELGNGTLEIEGYGDTFRNDTASDQKKIYGYSYINLTSHNQENDTRLEITTSTQLRCHVRNNLESDISGYPVSFYRNGTEFATGTTSQDGEVSAVLDAPQSISAYNISCGIEDNNTLMYNASKSVDSKIFQVYDDTAPQVQNLSIQPERIQPGEKFNVSYTATDSTGIENVDVKVTSVDGSTETLEAFNNSGTYIANYTTSEGLSGTYEVQAEAQDPYNNTGIGISTISVNPGGEIQLSPEEYDENNLTYFRNSSRKINASFRPENPINSTNLTYSTNRDSPVYISKSKTTCGDLNSSENCEGEFRVIVENGTVPGTYYARINAEWINPLQNEQNSIREILEVNVGPNPVFSEEYGNWEDSIQHGSSKILTSSIGGTNYLGFIGNSTGNVPVKSYSVDVLNSSGRLEESWINLRNDYRNRIEAGEVTTTRVNVSIPQGTAPGDYRALVNLETGNAGEVFRNITVTVPGDPGFNASPSNRSVYAVINQTNDLENFYIRNNGNINISLSTEFEGNASSNLFTEPIEVPVNENRSLELGYRNFTDNRTREANITFSSQEIRTSSGTVTVLDNSKITVDPIRFKMRVENSKDRLRKESGSIIRQKVNLTQSGETKFNNTSYNIRVNDTEAEILNKTVTENLTELRYVMPELEDGKLYDLRITARDTVKEIETWRNLSEKYYIPDVTPPDIRRLEASDVSTGSKVTINATITDNHYRGLENVTFIIESPEGNETVINATKNNSYWIERLNQTALGLEGDYSLDVRAVDPGNNSVNASTMFRYTNSTDFSGSFTDASGSPQKAEMSFKDPDTGKVLQKLSVDEKNNSYNTSLLEGSYDIEVNYSGNSIELNNAEVNGSISDGLKFDEVSTSSAPLADRQSTEAALMSLAGETGMNIENAEIKFNYSEYQEKIPVSATAEDFVVTRCQDYSYQSIDCNGEYEVYNLTNTSINRAEKTITLETPGFSIYNIVLPGEGFMEPESSGPQSPGGGGGGSTLNSPATQENITQLQDQLQDISSPLEIQDQKIEVSLRPGESRVKLIRVLNNMDTEAEFTANVSETIQRFFEVQNSVNVAPGTVADLQVNASVSSETEFDIYRGEINVAGGGESRSIPATIRIEDNVTVGREDTLELDLQPEQNTVNPGSNLSFRISATPSVAIVSKRVNLTYLIRKPGVGGKVVKYDNNSASFTGVYNNRTKIRIPEKTETGEYVLEAIGSYSFQGQTRNSSTISTIQIKKPLMQRTFLGLPLWIYLLVLSTLVIGGGGGYKGYQYYQNYIESQRRYKQEIDRASLPGPGEDGGSAYLGTLADRDDKAYLGLDQLTTHALVAGATGSGKSVTGQGIVEEALEQGVNVIVLDPTAQWSGYLRKCTSDDMIKLYSKFEMSANDARAYDGNIRAVDSPDDEIDIQYLLQNEDQSGSIVTFSLHKLESDDIEDFASSIIKQVFEANCSEREHLDTLIVFDEAHRLLEKFGGTGEGLNQLERGAREFRKWGIGMLLLSQVISDFPSEIRTNVGTKIQMRTRNQDDLDHYKDNYGMDTVRSIVKANVGSGMIQNSDYNGGNPYFVNFRPLKHSVHRLSDEELDKYEKYNRRIDQVEEKIEKLEDQGEDVYEYQSNLKLCRKNLRKGSFNLVDIYLDELQDQLEDV